MTRRPYRRDLTCSLASLAATSIPRPGWHLPSEVAAGINSVFHASLRSIDHRSLPVSIRCVKIAWIVTEPDASHDVHHMLPRKTDRLTASGILGPHEI